VGRLVGEAVGEAAAGLAATLLRTGPANIKKLTALSLLSLAQIHKVLTRLQQLQLVEQRNADYCLRADAVQARLRFPLYVELAQRECSAGEGMQAALDLGSFSLQVLATKCGELQVTALTRADFLVPAEERVPALKRNSSASPTPRKKPKLSKSVSEAAQLSDETHVVNWKVMDQRLIHRKIVKLVGKEEGERAALLVFVLLSLARPVTVSELTALFPAVLGFSSEEVAVLLASLSAYLQPSGTRFALSPTVLLERLQVQTISQLVTSQLGEYAGRIVLLLQNRSRLSEASIGDLGLLPGREACKVLERLETAGVVQQVSSHWQLNPALREQLSASLASVQEEQEQWLVLSTQSCY